jgi:hypothetical protein
MFDDSLAGKQAWEWLEKRIDQRLATSRSADADLGLQPMRTRWEDPLERINVAYEEWLDALSARRAVWCWASPEDPRFRPETYESLAMWNLYARSGVAIKTSFKSLASAISTSPDLKHSKWRAIRAEYHRKGYAIPGLTEGDRLKQPIRPFAFKNQSYDYESEVRIVFRVNGAARLPGVVAEVDPHELLKDGEIIVSPFLPASEADDLVKAVKKLLKYNPTADKKLEDDPTIPVRRSTERQAEGEQSRLAWKDFRSKEPGAEPFAPEEGIPKLLLEL